jgi:hypothetical protein
VTPDTVIGKDYETEETMTAGIHGYIKTIHSNLLRRSLTVTVTRDGAFS